MDCVTHESTHSRDTLLQQELAALIDQLTLTDGAHTTRIDGLCLMRASQPSDPVHGISNPSFCVIAQGRKQVTLGDECFTYDPLYYLVGSVSLPVTGQIIEATPERPYLCIRINLDPAEITRLIADAGPTGVPVVPAHRGLYVERVDNAMLDAVTRLVRLLHTPRDAAMLAPLVLREIYYRLLRSPQGYRLYEMAITNSQTHRVNRAINWLNQNYIEPLKIDELARRVNLSPSTLHHRFKAVTAMSPLQYQKQLRLQEAKRLMPHEGIDCSSAAHRVGYESPSQFSREYSRLFGAPPMKDMARLRASA
ncbi:MULTISPECIES: AraC family transcriptional regulator [Pseudomonas]|uniref:AraC family transcriptional regulator n=1 Tax=Pseudomonas luteola TaxID=47886 RepID=A0ABS0FK37_PSELU|nr:MULTISPECIES: AraC family transcriptional regulator [Pseudomonas]MBF8640711.1 AraC family transcriptional regulator [Pseudomonas zeshuii]RRW49621.1 AraC family transcriptional regulator [Pseudomonas luteola]SHI75606.1 AraC-type DNA-binding protein [Pseudomonas zeshuii]